MGMNPRQVDELTLWEFQCCAEGFRKAHSTEEDRPPQMSEDRMRELGIEGV